MGRIHSFYSPFAQKLFLLRWTQVQHGARMKLRWYYHLYSLKHGARFSEILNHSSSQSGSRPSVRPWAEGPPVRAQSGEPYMPHGFLRLFV